jgi:ABC-2 type transport system ATP-binding protein
MTSVLETNGLGKRYGRQWALRDCTLQVPAGSVAGLVGLNGAGKTTLMHLAAGLIEPSAGHIQVLGESPSQTLTSFLARIGFVAQERPLYRSFSVKDMLTLGGKLNAHWDDRLARELLERMKIPLPSLVVKLSGGQQAQIALVLALAKRPQLLLLDEPFANVDPLARREFSKIVMETVASNEMTVLLSSNILEDLENICDYMVILSAARVQVASDIEALLAAHKWLIGPYDGVEAINRTHVILQSSHRGRQSHLLVRTNGPIHHPSWQVQEVTLKEIVLAYLGSQSEDTQPQEQSKEEVLK